jgi:hypothetical protein
VKFRSKPIAQSIVDATRWFPGICIPGLEMETPQESRVLDGEGPGDYWINRPAKAYMWISGNRIHVGYGDWVVTSEGGSRSVVSNREFLERYEATHE